MLKFITGNKNKFQEIKQIIPEIEQLDIDLPEIQSLDAREIIKFKLEAALKNVSGDIIVEDTSLYIEGLNGLPGPLIKWFVKTIGSSGLAKIAVESSSVKAQAKTIIGYANSQGEISFFEGNIHGQIVSPRGETNFGWDGIFQPDTHSLTFAELGTEEKNKISMRSQATKKLAKFLNC